MNIRSERESDIETIAAITKAAFATEPHSRQTEQFIIAALRAPRCAFRWWLRKTAG